MVSHAIEVKVRWSEADPAGIVFRPRFFEWFGLATEALVESLSSTRWPRGTAGPLPASRHMPER